MNSPSERPDGRRGPDPARRPRRVLRVGRGARRPVAAGQARRRRRRRRARRHRERQLRGASLRRAQRDAERGGAARAARRCHPARPLRALRGVLAPVPRHRARPHARRRAARARRGVRRPAQPAAPARSTRSKRPGTLRRRINDELAPALRRRTRAQQALREARLEGVQAPTSSRADSSTGPASSGSAPSRRRSGSTCCRCVALGRRSGDRGEARPARASPTCATSRASTRRRSPPHVGPAMAAALAAYADGEDYREVVAERPTEVARSRSDLRPLARWSRRGPRGAQGPRGASWREPCASAGAWRAPSTSSSASTT